MGETVGVEMRRERDTTPPAQHSYLEMAAGFLRLADATEAAEAKAQYVLLASLYQRLSELSADSRRRRASAGQ